MFYQLRICLILTIGLLNASCGGGNSSNSPSSPTSPLNTNYGPIISPSTVIPSGLSASQSGNGDPVSTTTGYPVRSALANIFKTGATSTLNLSGTLDQGSGYGIYGLLNITINPPTQILFNGQLVDSNTITAIGVDSLGGDPTINLSQTQITNGNLQTLAIDNGNYCPGTTIWAYPSFVDVAQSGTLGDYICYTDATSKTIAGKLSFSYEGSIDQYGDLIFGVVSTAFDTSDKIISVTTLTFSINSMGAAKITSYSSIFGTSKYSYQMYAN